MRILIAFFILLPGLFCSGQDTLKVLFVGNSFMYFNDLPGMFSQLALGAGKNVVVASRMPGGASVGDTIQGTFAHMYNPEVYALIKNNQWDYLFLQDRQSRFAMSNGVFPGDSRVVEGHAKIRDSLLFYNPCAHMLWFAGFGTKNGYPPYSPTGEGLIDSIYQNYSFLKDSIGEVIAPVGPAFLRIMAGFPEIDLWGPDGEHPSMKGSLLIASVLYSTVFKSSAIESTWNPGIPADQDSIINTVGYQATVDSIGQTGLSEITPEVIQIGDSLIVPGFQDCTWFFNGTVIQSANCGVKISLPGRYYAMVSDSAGCLFRTMEKHYTVLTGQADRIPSKHLPLPCPNPASGNIIITLEPNTDCLTIVHSSGRVMEKIVNPASQVALDISAWPTGLFLICTFNNGRISGKSKFLRLVIN